MPEAARRTFSVHPLLEADLPAIADFIGRQVLATDESEAQPGVVDVAIREAQLRHRLIDNPARSEQVPLGHLLRGEDGRLVGTSLIFPWQFVRGEQRLLGLGNGALYVEPEARMQGFLLYRRFLGVKAADFWYATTCNAASAALWSRSKAAPVHASHREFHLVIHAGPVAEEMALRRGMGGAAARVAGVVGRLATPFVGPKRSRGAAARHTEDWERLAAIAAGNRDPERIACERSMEYLRWTYHRSHDRDRPRVYVFDAGSGRAGWFAIGRRIRGRRGQIRDVSLLDWSFPPELDWRIGIGAAIDTVVGLRDADMFSIEGRVDLSEELEGHGFRGRTHPAPTSFVVGRELPSAELADALVIPTSDRF